MEVRQISFGGVGGLKRITPTTIAQLKDDGGQYCLHIQKGKAYALTSKRVSAKTGVLVDKIDCFPHINNKAFPFTKETILVVEVSAHHIAEKTKRRTTVTSIMGTSPQDIIAPNYKALKKGEFNLVSDIEERPKVNHLKMIAHDFMMFEGGHMDGVPYKERYRLVRKFFKSGGRDLTAVNPYSDQVIWAIENIRMQDLNDLFFRGEKNYDTFTFSGIKQLVDDNGFDEEGLVLKDMETGEMAKVKKTITADCIVVDFTSGNGKYAGMIGALIVAVFVKIPPILKKLKNSLSEAEVEQYLKSGELVKCGKVSGMDDSLRKYISDNRDEYVGVAIECEFMEWTGKAMFQPRFKAVRDEKDIRRCTIEQFGEDMEI